MPVYRVKVTRKLVLETTILVRASTVTEAESSAARHAAEGMSDDEFDTTEHDEAVSVLATLPVGETEGEEVVDRTP